jgi:predicted GNAT family N-acyltransferase
VIRVSNAKEREAVLAIREEVFIGEQGVPQEIELDQDDREAVHVLAVEHEEAVGCGRVVFKKGYAKLGRIAVKKGKRRQGIGKQICRELIQIAREHDVERLILHAQVSVVGFYESLGFSVTSDVFEEAGIEHVCMERELKVDSVSCGY